MNDDSRPIKTSPHYQKPFKNKNDPTFIINKDLYRSNSDNDLLDLKDNKNKNKSKNHKKNHYPKTKSEVTYLIIMMSIIVNIVMV